MNVIFFFFSSRRRHTRLQGDWSSDVCSSDLGVLTCGTGLGMAYVANRFARVRAAVAWSPEIAELARKHNDANVLVLPSRFVSEEEGMEILHRWLETGFEGGRHARRVAKIDHD